MFEIERKFLVKSDDFKAFARAKQHIAQGYLSSHPDRSVRIRIKGEVGFLTIKGKSNDSGTTRYEWETEIPLSEAKSIFKLAEPGQIEKIRWEVEVGRHVFEVDEFIGENAGLIVAEVELSSEDEAFERPDWLGPEVTNDIRYYNSNLVKHPFSKW